MKFFKNKFVIGALILFGALILYNINSDNNGSYSKNNSNSNSEGGNLRNKAVRAVDAASACYRSLPSHAQSVAVHRMLSARKDFNDAVKFLNMDEFHSRSMAPYYFNNAITDSDVVMAIGRTYGSRSCG